MGIKRHKPEEIVSKLRQVDVLVGQVNEFPCINYPEDYVEGAFEYTLEPGMTLCVEAFIGSEHGGEGVKPENQVLVIESGAENLTKYPFEDRLMV